MLDDISRLTVFMSVPMLFISIFFPRGHWGVKVIVALLVLLDLYFVSAAYNGSNFFLKEVPGYWLPIAVTLGILEGFLVRKRRWELTQKTN